MNGTPTRRAISMSAPAMAPACPSLSMTQGPAISANGFPAPRVTSPTTTGFTATL